MGFIGSILILFLKILLFEVLKDLDLLLGFAIFEVEVKLRPQGLRFKLEFWGKNFLNLLECRVV